jgi:hypothetical protein
MKQVAAAILLALSLAGCASNRAASEEPGLPSLVPPPDVAPAPTNPATEAKLAELQTSMTELLERLDVLNSRIARLEGVEGESRVVAQPQPRVQETVPVPRAIEPAPVPRSTETPILGQRHP